MDTIANTINNNTATGPSAVVSSSMAASYCSALVIAAAAVAIAYFDYSAASIKKNKFASPLNQALWKMQTPREVLLKYDTINWRKLVAAGWLLSASLVLMLSKKLSLQTAMAVGATFAAGWSAFIYWFWHNEIASRYDDSKQGKEESSSDNSNNSTTNSSNDNSSNNSNSSNSKKGIGAGWEAKRRDIKSSEDSRLPVTILTGFLGSGKTTLLKSLLSNTVGLKILVIENEIGSEGVDHSLLVQQTDKENIILMNNGCICCTVRKDLIDTFHALFTKPELAQIDWVVIETTGLADPAPMVQSMYMDQQCKQRMRLDSVITIVDAVHFPAHVNKYLQDNNNSNNNNSNNSNNSDSKAKGSTSGAHGGIPEPIQQVIFADRIIISKTDLIDREERQERLKELEAFVRMFNAHADVIYSERGAVSPADLLGLKAYDLLSSAKQELLRQAAASTSTPSFLALDASGKISTQKKSFNILKPVNVAQKDGSAAAAAIASSVESISLHAEQPLDLDKFNEWTAELLQNHGQDLYRLKGLLYMKGYEGKVFVAHGVHMIFEGEVCEDWERSSGKGESTLVLIGRELGASDLKAGFAACVA